MTDCILVLWIDENPQKLSVMAREDIVDGAIRLTSSLKLIDTVVTFKWNRQQHRGKIIRFGPKAQMQESLKVESLKRLAHSNSSDTNDQELVKPSEETSNKRYRIEAIMAKSTGVRQNLGPSFEAATVIESIKKELNTEKMLHEELKGKFNELLNDFEELKEEHRQCSSNESTDIGNGVLVNTSTVTTIKAISSSLNLFGRNLFRAVFATDEIVGRSLMGRRCNANGNREVLPSIDPEKRDAVIDYCLKTFKKQPGSDLFKYAKKDLKHSLASLVLEMNKDATRLEREVQE